MKGLDEGDKKLLSDIETIGWHVVLVKEDEKGPGFGYSVGLFQTFGHPEIIIVGLKLELIHVLINNIGEDVRSGMAYESGQFYQNILDNYECLILEVSKENYREYVGYDLWYYKSDRFPILQCVYPTVKGYYPWQDEWPKEESKIQPILGELKLKK